MTTAVFPGPGFIFQQVHPEPRLIQKRVEQPPEEVFGFQEDVHNVLHQVRSLSEDEDAHSGPTEHTGPEEYSSALSSFYRISQTLLTERFLEELPRTAVCILSGRQNCGPEADLTQAVWLDLIKPLLGSTVSSQTCAPGAGDAESARASLGMGESISGTLPSLQHWIVDALSSLPSSGNHLAALSGLIDATMSRALEFTAALLQVPVDYVKLALQFGIGTPSLDDKETCEQGKTLLNG